ncbi:hypothetical protein PCCS19_26460 [Paenibacillus sp. CCS19]|nr:hypothetical protein PCCS19_26460 [Paenibacillus cellulosilyticus]
MSKRYGLIVILYCIPSSKEDEQQTQQPWVPEIRVREEYRMSGVYGGGGFTTAGVILVLFILLVIVTRGILY